MYARSIIQVTRCPFQRQSRHHCRRFARAEGPGHLEAVVRCKDSKAKVSKRAFREPTWDMVLCSEAPLAYRSLKLGAQLRIASKQRLHRSAIRAILGCPQVCRAFSQNPGRIQKAQPPNLDSNVPIVWIIERRGRYTFWIRQGVWVDAVRKLYLGIGNPRQQSTKSLPSPTRESVQSASLAIRCKCINQNPQSRQCPRDLFILQLLAFPQRHSRSSLSNLSANGMAGSLAATAASMGYPTAPSRC